MPELPEVETVRKILESVLKGKSIKHVVLKRAGLRFPFPKNFSECLEGRTILQIKRRAKYLLFYFDKKEVLLAHLGMSGSFRVVNKTQLNRNPHDHVTFTTNSNITVHYNDPRRFGFMDIINSERLAEHPRLRDLGPEPLSKNFNSQILRDGLSKRNGPIKPVLLDQKLIAGIGNIYACEALFRAKLSPRRIASNIRDKRVTELVQSIKNVLHDAIEAGGSTLRNYQHPDGKIGYFQNAFNVYGRDGQSCPNCICSHGIKKITQSGRSTFFCSKYQR